MQPRIVSCSVGEDLSDLNFVGFTIIEWNS